MIRFERIIIPENNLKTFYCDKKLTTFDIAKIYGCCQATIWKRLHYYKIQPRLSGVRRVKISKEELEDLYVAKKLSSRKIAKIYNCAYSTIDNKIRNYGFRIRNRAESHIIYPRKSFDGNYKNKSYLIGFSLGDLRVRKQFKNSETISIECGSTKQEQISLIKDLFSPYGHVWISKPINGKISIGANLDSTFSFLLIKNIDEFSWIFNNKNIFLSFLAGFIDAEGSFFITKGKGRFSLGNYNKDILFVINKKLKEIGIKCSGPYESKTKGYLTKDGYLHNQNYWQINIAQKNSLLKLIGILEPYLKHNKRIKDMKKVKENVVQRNKLFGDKSG